MGDKSPSAVPWSLALTSLVSELAVRPGRLALLRQTPDTDSTLKLMAEALGQQPLSVGLVLTLDDGPPSSERIAELLADATLLVDLDVLFWEPLGVDPIALLTLLARKRPRVALWPGQIVGDRAVYSEPGRRDYFSQLLVDAIVLTPRRVVYPDETPYAIERIQA
jgi:hypothetical protein